MREFEKNKGIYEKSYRGVYLIIPVKRHDNNSTEHSFDEQRLFVKEKFTNELDDKSDLIKKRCENGFLKKYIFAGNQANFFNYELENLHLSDFRLYMFENGIGFVTLFAFCKNANVRALYELVNSGYIGAKNDHKIYRQLSDKINSIINSAGLEIFVDRKLLLNDSYIFNVALTECRFEELETLNQLTLNTHKQIGLEEDFTDESERDLSFVYGAKDVNLKTYRWGCCISSLDAAFVYGDPEIKGQSEKQIANIMKRTSESDLLTTILVLVQKYSCMRLNDEIFETLVRGDKISGKNIREMKSKTVRFKTTDTLTSSQVSRWHNVCQIYESLMSALGLDEAMREIEDKTELLNAEEEREEAKRQNLIATVITIFGFVSIVEAVLSAAQIISSGSPVIMTCFAVSTGLLIVFLALWLFIFLKRH